MSGRPRIDGDRHEAGRYEIRLKGRLDTRWAAWFEGLSFTHQSDGSTVIHGSLADQAALHGLLQKVRDVGLPLVSVKRIEPDQPVVPTIEPRKATKHQEEIDMTNATTAATKRVPTDSWRKLALAGGVMYLITIIASIPAVFLLGPVLNDPNYIVSAGADRQVVLGAFLDLITALACIGTAVALYPVIRRQSEAASLGFVTTRIFEAGVIVIGVISLLAVVTLRQSGGAAGSEAGALVAVGQGLVAVRDVTFLLGPGFVPGLNAMLLGYALYRSRLVPRVIPAIGLIGAPLFLVSASASILGLNEQVSVLSGIALIPIFLWELSLGLWLTFKGFGASAVAALAADSTSTDASGTPAASRTVIASNTGAA